MRAAAVAPLRAERGLQRWHGAAQHLFAQGRDRRHFAGKRQGAPVVRARLHPAAGAVGLRGRVPGKVHLFLQIPHERLLSAARRAQGVDGGLLQPGGRRVSPAAGGMLPKLQWQFFAVYAGLWRAHRHAAQQRGAMRLFRVARAAQSLARAVSAGDRRGELCLQPAGAALDGGERGGKNGLPAKGHIHQRCGGKRGVRQGHPPLCHGAVAERRVSKCAAGAFALVRALCAQGVWRGGGRLHAVPVAGGRSLRVPFAPGAGGAHGRGGFHAVFRRGFRFFALSGHVFGAGARAEPLEFVLQPFARISVLSRNVPPRGRPRMRPSRCAASRRVARGFLSLSRRAGGRAFRCCAHHPPGRARCARGAQRRGQNHAGQADLRPHRSRAGRGLLWRREREGVQPRKLLPPVFRGVSGAQPVAGAPGGDRFGVRAGGNGRRARGGVPAPRRAMGENRRPAAGDGQPVWPRNF